MADSGSCEAAVRKVNEATSRMAETGKNTVNNLMKPIRDMKTRELELATISNRTNAQQLEKDELKTQIASHYGDGRVTTEKTTFSTALKGDSEVKAYVQNMNYDEFSEFRSELQNTFGGEQARMVESEFRDAKIPVVRDKLMGQGLYSDAINNTFITMKSSGVLSDRNIMQLKALEDIGTNGLALEAGKSRQLYRSMKNNIGEEITQDLFAQKINKNLQDLREMEKSQTIKNALMKQTLTKDEEKLLSDIATGKQIPDGNAFEAIEKMMNKVSDDGWNTIRGTIRPLEELDGPARKAVTQKMTTQGTGILSKTSSTIKTGITVVGIAATAGFVIPGAIIGYEVFAGTNRAEMLATFQQFKLGEDPTENLEKALLDPDVMNKIDRYIKYLDNWDNRWPMSIINKIPWYRDYVHYAVEDMITGNNDAVKQNIKDMFISMESMGLVERGQSVTGYTVASKDRRREIYANDPDKLFRNDKKYQEENSPWGQGGSGIQTKSGTELTKTQAVALYLYKSGGHDISPSDAGLDFDDIDEQTTKMAMEFGEQAISDAKQKYGTSSTTTSATKETTYSLEELTSMGLTCEGGESCSQEMYDKNIRNGWFVYHDAFTGKAAWGQPGDKVADDTVLDKGIRDVIGSGLTGTTGGTQYIKTTSGGGGNDEKQLTARQIQTRDMVRNEGISPNEEYINAIRKRDGSVDLSKAEEDDVSITELAKVDYTATKEGFKGYVETMKQKDVVNVDKFNEMKQVNEAEAKKALFDAYKCE